MTITTENIDFYISKLYSYSINESDFDKYKKIYNEFLGYGFNPLSKNSGGNTLLHIPFCSKKFIDFILELGIDINTKNNNGITPLNFYMLQYCPNIKIIQYLIEKGANPMIFDKGGNTILHTYYLDERIIDYLSKHIDINTKNNKGETPLHFYMKNKNFNKNFNINIIKCFIKNSANITSIDNINHTILHNFYESRDIYQYFIENGTNLFHKDNYGNTSLHFYMMSEHIDIEIIKMFIDNGADINIRNKENKLPIDYVRYYSFNIQIMKLFLHHGSKCTDRILSYIGKYDANYAFMYSRLSLLKIIDGHNNNDFNEVLKYIQTPFISQEISLFLGYSPYDEPNIYEIYNFS